MKILFDYQAFQFQIIGGVSRSYTELINRMKDECIDSIVAI